LHKKTGAEAPFGENAVTEERGNFGSDLICTGERRPGVFEPVNDDSVAVYVGGADALPTFPKKLRTDRGPITLRNARQNASSITGVDYTGELTGCSSDSPRWLP